MVSKQHHRGAHEAEASALGKGARIADRAGSAAGRLGDEAVDAMEQAGEVWRAAREAGLRAAHAASHQVESHPWPSVGLAFTAGLVAGVVVDRWLRD